MTRHGSPALWRHALARRRRCGLVKGAGRGLVGFFAKPISGLAGAVAKTTEGLGADAKRITLAGNADSRRLQMRVRQPRVIGADGVLLPYPRAPMLDQQHSALREDDEEQQPVSTRKEDKK